MKQTMELTDEQRTFLSTLKAMIKEEKDKYGTPPFIIRDVDLSTRLGWPLDRMTRTARTLDNERAIYTRRGVNHNYYWI